MLSLGEHDYEDAIMKMHSLRIAAFLVVTIFGAAALSFSQRASADQRIRERFVGAWRLVWLEEEDSDGKVHRADCTGLLVYTRDGKMSVQVMYREPQRQNESASIQYAQGGYEASFGTYKIDDAHSFTFHVEGALVRALIGKDLKRVFELSENRLIVKSPDPNEHWRVTWEHY
jgi:hypothetical protein